MTTLNCTLKLLGFKGSVLEHSFFPFDKPTLICIGSIYHVKASILAFVPWWGRCCGDSGCCRVQLPGRRCTHGHVGRGGLTPARSALGTGPAGHRWQLRRPRFKKCPLKIPQGAANLDISAGTFPSLVQQGGLPWVCWVRSLLTAQASPAHSCEAQPQGQQGGEVTDRPAHALKHGAEASAYQNYGRAVMANGSIQRLSSELPYLGYAPASSSWPGWMWVVEEQQY